MFRNNNKSAFDNSDFVTEAVLDLLKNGCIEDVKINIFHSNKNLNKF
jgi:hypothetical protein